MRIISWNVNGLRAVGRNGHWQSVWNLKPDVLCLQEVKAEPEQLDQEMLTVPGFTALFNPSRARRGYSGVATYTNREPLATAFGIGDEHFDREGRVLTTHFEDFILLNVYFPNGGRGPDRLRFKLDFYDAFLEHIEALREQYGKPVVFCGDVNTAHEEIDLARPKENEKNTGFLPEEREWIDAVVAHGYVDVYRHDNPDRTGAYTYWDIKSRARDRNVGWRIDYFFAAQELMPRIANPRIHTEVFGSDHCPLSIEIV